ncbi:MAG: hypothetical protein JWO59_3265 [Chloroflexi bacterium]|nr:hypothetical protein [Chloroflexota bacterium]
MLGPVIEGTNRNNRCERGEQASCSASELSRGCGRLRRHVFREVRWWDVWLGEVLRDEWEAAAKRAE